MLSSPPLPSSSSSSYAMREGHDVKPPQRKLARPSVRPPPPPPPHEYAATLLMYCVGKPVVEIEETFITEQ